MSSNAAPAGLTAATLDPRVEEARLEEALRQGLGEPRARLAHVPCRVLAHAAPSVSPHADSSRASRGLPAVQWDPSLADLLLPVAAACESEAVSCRVSEAVGAGGARPGRSSWMRHPLPRTQPQPQRADAEEAIRRAMGQGETCVCEPVCLPCMRGDALAASLSGRLGSRSARRAAVRVHITPYSWSVVAVWAVLGVVLKSPEDRQSRRRPSTVTGKRC